MIRKTIFLIALLSVFFFQEKKIDSHYLAPKSLSIQANDLSWIEREFGHVPLPYTTDLLFNSLGTFDSSFREEKVYLDQLMPWETMGALSFHLNQAGKTFFSELMGCSEEEVEPRAQLLVYRVSKDPLLKKYYSNVRRLPYGLMVRSSKQSTVYFLNISDLFLGTEGKFNSKIDLYARSGPYHKLYSILYRPCIEYFFLPTERKNVIASLLTETEVSSDSVLPENEQLKLLKIKPLYFSNRSIRRQIPFAPDWEVSLDFQESIYMKKNLFPGQVVQEVGIGLGVNLIYALKYGAEKVYGTDLFASYLLLSKWNLLFAQETQQISPLKPYQVRLAQQSGFGSFPLANIYLFNTPVVRVDRDLERDVSKDLLQRATTIDPETFSELFNELKGRLSIGGLFAIWRISIFDSAQLVSLTDDELFDYVSPTGEVMQKGEIKKGKLISKKFLQQSGLNFSLLHHPKTQFGKEIFFLTAFDPIFSVIGQSL